MSRTTGLIMHMLFPKLVPFQSYCYVNDRGYITSSPQVHTNRSFIFSACVSATSEPRIEQDPGHPPEGGDSIITPQTIEDRLDALT